MKEDDIISRFGVAPGELYGRMKIADWLLYAMQELGFCSGRRTC